MQILANYASGDEELTIDIGTADDAYLLDYAEHLASRLDTTQYGIGMSVGLMWQGNKNQSQKEIDREKAEVQLLRITLKAVISELRYRFTPEWARYCQLYNPHYSRAQGTVSTGIEKPKVEVSAS